MLHDTEDLLEIELSFGCDILGPFAGWQLVFPDEGVDGQQLLL